MTPSDLPRLNASLNALAALFLFLGWLAIRRRDEKSHKRWMLMALSASALFLISYVTYHTLVPGVTRYQGVGIWRGIYFTILLTHTPLAVIIVPFCLMAVRHALRGDFKKHTRITRWLFPVWVYVSLTGVVIYLMLYVFS